MYDGDPLQDWDKVKNGAAVRYGVCGTLSNGKKERGEMKGQRLKEKARLLRAKMRRGGPIL